MSEPTYLDWRSHKVGDAKPCRLCGQPAIMRDANGDPCHKVCAQRAIDNAAARNTPKEPSNVDA